MVGMQEQRPLIWVGTAPACTRLQFTGYLLTQKGIQGQGPWLRLICFPASWIHVWVRQFILHYIANLMKDPSSLQVLKSNEGPQSCLDITFAMLPQGKGICVSHGLGSGVSQVNHPISMPKYTADKPTALQSSKSEFPRLAKAADPGWLCPSVVTDTLMIIPRRQVWGEGCTRKHVYVRVSATPLSLHPQCHILHLNTNFTPKIITHSSTAEIEQNTKTRVWVTCLGAWCLAYLRLDTIFTAQRGMAMPRSSVMEGWNSGAPLLASTPGSSYCFCYLSRELQERKRKGNSLIPFHPLAQSG